MKIIFDEIITFPNVIKTGLRGRASNKVKKASSSSISSEKIQVKSNRSIRHFLAGNFSKFSINETSALALSL